MLDGSNLSGWKVVGDANWLVENQAARADRSTAASFLVSEDSFADFELELEFWVNSEANSGVFLRCQNAATIADTSCYEVNNFERGPIRPTAPAPSSTSPSPPSSSTPAASGTG